jgi:hypothetical protein
LTVDVIQVLMVVVVAEALMIIALLLLVFGQGKQLGSAYPADVKAVLGALAGLAVFFAAQSPTALDDTVVTTILLPVFQLLGINVTAPGSDNPPAAPAPPGA